MERFANDCRITNSKLITLSNHDMSKQRDKPISSFLLLAHSSMEFDRPGERSPQKDC